MDAAAFHNRKNAGQFLVHKESGPLSSSSSCTNAPSASSSIDIENLLKKAGVDVQWLLHEAASMNLVDHMAQLVNDYGADVNSISIVFNLTDETKPVHPQRNPIVNAGKKPPLLEAAQEGCVAAVKWLLDHGANPNAQYIYLQDDYTNIHEPRSRITALWAAAELGNIRVAHLLLHAGADVNTVKHPTGNSALYIAVQNGHGPMVTLLLQHGADPNVYHIGSNNTETSTLNHPPIVIAVTMAKCNIVAQLMNAGARVEENTTLDRVLQTLRETKKTVGSPHVRLMRSISEEELKLLETLLCRPQSKQRHKCTPNPEYAKAQLAEREGDYWEALRRLQTIAEQQDKASSSFPSVAQLKFDIQRMVDTIYGVSGSDGRVSVWNQIPCMSKTQPPSAQYQAWTRSGRYIYTHGGIDFMCVSPLEHRLPQLDEVWRFHMDTRKWDRLDIRKGIGIVTPGLRAGHSMFVFRNCLYVWGGSAGQSTGHDAKLYRLRMGTVSTNNTKPLAWEVVKLKSSMKPPPREEHAGILYKEKYYVTGGNLLSTRDLTNDLWCLNLLNFKWSALKCGGVERHCHGMWAAYDKLYILGGRAIHSHVTNPIKASHTVCDFNSYDIKTKIWRKEQVFGDAPHDISEYTVLPIYDDKTENPSSSGTHPDDPSCVIVWGGYTEVDQSAGPPSFESMQNKYGDDCHDFKIPYRNRLLRFDISTNSWTLLKPTRELLPKAQSFAADISSGHGQTRLLVGGGYGYGINCTPDTSDNKTGMKGMDFMDFVDPVFKEVFDRNMSEIGNNEHSTSPVASQNIYEVTIADERSFVKDIDEKQGSNSQSGSNSNSNNLIGQSSRWAWDFFDSSSDKIPALQVDLAPCSPTLHTVLDLTYQDFCYTTASCSNTNQTPETLQPNDVSTLGVHVKLVDLKGRSDLNGQVARRGPWLVERQRYEVFLPAYEPSGPAIVAVKPLNIQVAPKWNVDDGQQLTGLIQNCVNTNQCSRFPVVSMYMALPDLIDGKQKLSPLDRLELKYPVSSRNTTSKSKKEGVTLFGDTYHGPVSAKAQAVLRAIAVANTTFQHTMSCMFLPPDITNATDEKVTFTTTNLPQCKYDSKACKEIQSKLQHRELFIQFYRDLRKTDSQRVKLFEKHLASEKQTASSRTQPIHKHPPKWFKLTVSLDGIVPQIQRELIVSPNISMQNLHHQVLCPAIGWTNNFHCYAFRRIYGRQFYHTSTNDSDDETKEGTNPGENRSKAVLHSMNQACQMMHEECWIGPKTSTALDTMFQPLYIGGAMANDKKLSLGDLCYGTNTPMNERGETNLQYVHDFGDWWSHTITITTFDDKTEDIQALPANVSVAHLLSGRGGCPPEDIGGVCIYCRIMAQLLGKMSLSNDSNTNNNRTNRNIVQPSSQEWWALLNTEVTFVPNTIG